MRIERSETVFLLDGKLLLNQEKTIEGEEARGQLVRHDSKPPRGASNHISKELAARDGLVWLELAEVA